MKEIIVFDGIQLIMFSIALIFGLFILIMFGLDKYSRKHPNSKFIKWLLKQIN